MRGELPEGENDRKQSGLVSFFKNDSALLGIIPGILGPIAGFYFYYLMQFADTLSFHGFIRFVSSPGILSKVMSLSVLMNLPIFFIFIQLKFDKSARSVLGATFVYAAVIAYIKFFG